jgi:hypothetical protein
MKKKINNIFLIISIFLNIYCSEKPKQINDNFNAIKSATSALEKSQKNISEFSNSSTEAKKIYSERVANGDTITMNYKELQNYLLDEIEGMKPDGVPNGSNQTVMGFSMSSIEREWKQDDSSFSQRIHITITDIGCYEGSYQILAMPLIINQLSEKNNKKIETFNNENSSTFGLEEFDKVNQETIITIITRYRFLIKVNGKNFNGEVSTILKNYGLIIAKKFELK